MKAVPLKINSDSKAMGYEPCPVEEATHIMLNLPGPISTRIIPIIRKGKREGTNCWSWNGDIKKPTLKPSILTDTYEGDIGIRCHTWINDGKVIFLDDCSHKFAGQTLDLLEVDFFDEEKL